MKVIIYGIVVVVICTFAFCRGIFVNEKVAQHTLEIQGFEVLDIIDHDWFLVALRGCGEDDAAKFTAKVVNPRGDTVEICVCTGWIFKGATIRN